MRKNLFTGLRLFVVGLVLVGFMPVSSLLAQAGTILGTVHDETEAVLPGVSSTATNLETNQSRTVISGDEGRYLLSQLPS